MGRRPLSATLLAATLAAAFTLVVALTPSIQLAYRSPSLHLVIETAATVIAFLAALLALGRFRQSSLPGDLLLASGLVTLGLTNLVFGGLTALTGTTGPELTAWAPLTLRLLGTLLVAAAAFAPSRLLRRRHWSSAALIVPAGVLLVVGLAALLLDGTLPPGIDPTLSPEASGRPLLTGNPVLLGTHALAAVLLGAAALGFARKAGATDGGLFFWLGPALALAAFARVNYLLFPSLYSEWVYTGDLLRFGFYLLLFVGEVQEIRLYWRREARAAAFDERRRIARDLHDGLAQELAFIVREASGELPREQLAAAAERALAESRRAITALSTAADEPLDAALREAGDEVAHRAGGSVQYELDVGVEVPPELREALIRIAREAIGNAARHGRASRIRVRLERGDLLRLVVDDDGVGFDVATAARSGYGLTSMRERTEAAGGTFSIHSRAGRGTTVEVALP